MNWNAEIFLLLLVVAPFATLFGYFSLCLVVDVLRDSSFAEKSRTKRLYGRNL